MSSRSLCAYSKPAAPKYALVLFQWDWKTSIVHSRDITSQLEEGFEVLISREGSLLRSKIIALSACVYYATDPATTTHRYTVF
ncbi:hypothetical protein GJAV_G00077060 [Gymnothorax javanicus]|nr:hypothetical protein GJAV_G00077060 [Gymnothorax javanicus]